MLAHKQLSLQVSILIGASVVGCTYEGALDDVRPQTGPVMPAIDDNSSASSDLGAVERTAHSLFPQTGKIWPTPDNIPVCVYAHGGTFSTEETWTREALRDSWEAASRVRFTGWGACSDTSPVVKLRFIQGDDGSKVYPSLGTDNDQVFHPGVNFDGGKENARITNRKDAAGGDVTCGLGSREACVKATVVHEFGHILAYSHEHQRSDIAMGCNPPAGAQGEAGNSQPDIWDAFSVMTGGNCQGVYLNRGWLSPRDMMGNAVHYGYGTSPTLFFRSNGGSGTGLTGTLTANGTFTTGSNFNDTTPNWTHVVGTKTFAVLFYRSSDGFAKTGKLDQNGAFTSVAGSVNLGAGWTHITAAQSGFMFLYNSSAGTGRVLRIDAKGAILWTSPQGSGFSPFTHVVGLTNGALLLLNMPTGNAFLSRITPQGQYANVTGQFNVGGWTHVTGVNNNVFFFINTTSGAGRGLVTTNSVSDVSSVAGTISAVWGPAFSGFWSGWTSISGARNGAMFFSNGNTAGAGSFVNTAGGYSNGNLVTLPAGPWQKVTAM